MQDLYGGIAELIVYPSIDISFALAATVECCS